MRFVASLVLVAALAATTALAQDLAHDTGEAAKKVAHGSDKTVKGTVHATEVAGEQAAKGTSKAAKKTSHDSIRAGAKTGHGIKKAAKKTAKKTAHTLK